MSQDDEIARLMREVERFEGTGTPQQHQAGSKPDLAPPGSPRGAARGKWTLLAAAGGGAAGFVTGSVLFVLPWVDGLSTGIGAAFGAALAAYVSGPPDWLKK